MELEEEREAVKAKERTGNKQIEMKGMLEGKKYKIPMPGKS